MLLASFVESFYVDSDSKPSFGRQTTGSPVTATMKIL